MIRSALDLGSRTRQAEAALNPGFLFRGRGGRFPSLGLYKVMITDVCLEGPGLLRIPGYKAFSPPLCHFPAQPLPNTIFHPKITKLKPSMEPAT